MTVVSHFMAWLLAYKYSVLFPAAVVEGPIVTIVAGFFVAQGYLKGVIVYTIVILADIVGDGIYYVLGRWGREQYINRWGKYLGITPARLAQLEKYFVQHAGKTLLMGKLTHGVGVAILMAAGAAKVPFIRFIGFNFIASVPKSFALLLVGFYFGAAVVRLNRYLHYTALAMISISLVIVGGYVLVRLTLKKISERRNRLV